MSGGGVPIWLPATQRFAVVVRSRVGQVISMQRRLNRLHEVLLTLLTGDDAERQRRLRALDTEALVAARRLELIQLLTTRAAYHLRLAKLDFEESGANAAEFELLTRVLLDSQAMALAGVIAAHAPARSEVAR